MDTSKTHLFAFVALLIGASLIGASACSTDSELVTRVSELENELAELKELANVRTEVSALTAQLSSTESDVSALTTTAEALDAGVAALQEVDWSPTEEQVRPLVESLVEKHPELLRGPKGDKGNQGDMGPTGPEGPIGLQGEAGPRGETGAQGLQGEKGQGGETGPRGATGAQGPEATGAITGYTLNRCIDDLIYELLEELSASSGAARFDYYAGTTESWSAPWYGSDSHSHDHSITWSRYDGPGHDHSVYIGKKLFGSGPYTPQTCR
ncbi:MAG: hypothetical protein ISR43_06240 [Acidimicrobiia bacterium]|nr:hypothetical protein [Actinomycetota bacterium]MBL6926814.1 hypothetical protein [Acidimicrobiia bacterium]